MRLSDHLFTEDDLLPLSGLQHLLFCERQWALIHIEQQWEENRLTQEGRVLHERVHEAGTDARPDVVVARGLRVRSLRLGLVGRDRCGGVSACQREAAGAMQLEGRAGWWIPFPVEYKRGRPKRGCVGRSPTLRAGPVSRRDVRRNDRGGSSVLRDPPPPHACAISTPALRAQTEELARRMHEMYAAGTTPPAVYESKCEKCSLIERCMPKMSTRRRDVARYLATALRDVENAEDEA